jgi:hypothetical protein
MHTRFGNGEPLEVEFEFSADQPGQLREFAILVHAKEVRVAIVDLRVCGVAPLRYGKGRFAIRTRIVSLPLVEGELVFGLYVVTDHFAGNLLGLAELTIVESRFTQGFVSYPADARGFLVLSATASIICDQPQKRSQVSCPAEERRAERGARLLLADQYGGRAGIGDSLITRGARPAGRKIDRLKHQPPILGR